MNIAIFGNVYQASKQIQLRSLFAVLQKFPCKMLMQREYLDFLERELEMPLKNTEVIDPCAFVADIALSVGGDGTFLRTAAQVGDKGIPILGVNLGRLGFLADVSVEDIEPVMLEVLKHNYRIEERSLLYTEAEGLPDDFWPYALNEVAILKQESASMISVHTTVGNSYLNTYQADGLVVSTPTGSTAYSMSVGGPIIMPEAANWVISPVAPHSLTVRPLVVSDDMAITFRVDSRTHNYLLSVDGRSVALDTDTALVLRKAPYTIRVIKRYNHNFGETLRNKLLWGVDKRE